MNTSKNLNNISSSQSKDLNKSKMALGTTSKTKLNIC